MVTRYAHNGQVRIAYEDLGGAGGEPFLLVMGLGASRAWWPAGFVAALVEAGFHVVSYDQRDAGESTHFTDHEQVHPFVGLFRRRPVAYTAEDMTDDAVAVLDAMGWDTAHLFGHSLGGLLTQRFALRHPDRARTITVSGAMPSDARGLAQLRHVRLGFVLRASRLATPEDDEGHVAAGVALARRISSPGYAFDETTARTAVRRELAISHGLHDAGAQGRQTGAPWSGGRLAAVRTPTLVLHGEQDPVVRPSAARATAAAIPGARLVLLPGVGHDLPRELWPRVAGEIRALADRAAPPAATGR
ncbi:alpha/beta hydrolase [Pseudonocardia halophobica]|uniref:Alpha/beta hydrolase n=1 Tax=Pseudonocardia halophobica TaxID=29401 RepID=A0A9W6NZV8_9PSEU|nr:alpha/beta hydrolase [Pseudonocardia halophobica]GLL15257.1 alpha/beta hydrolase [Pseudonocardia halophobica]